MSPSSSQGLLLIATLADHAMRVAAAFYLVALLALAIAYHGLWFDPAAGDTLFMVYGAVVVSYITSRFLLSLPYRPPRDVGHEPRVAIVMPAFNEEGVIAALAALAARARLPRRAA